MTSMPPAVVTNTKDTAHEPSPPELTSDYIQILKYACRRVFKRAPSIITKCVGREGDMYFYSSLLVLPDGTRYTSHWSYTTIFETANVLCFNAIMADARLALDKENAYRWERDDFVRNPVPRIGKLRAINARDRKHETLIEQH